MAWIDVPFLKTGKELILNYEIGAKTVEIDPDWSTRSLPERRPLWAKWRTTNVW